MPEVPREIISMLLGSKICARNSDDRRVCIYINARSDSSVYIKVTVDGKKVAHMVVEPGALFTALAPAALALALGDDIEELWRIVKRRAAKTRGKRRATEEDEEEGEEEERGEEEEEEELEFA